MKQYSPGIFSFIYNGTLVISFSATLALLKDMRHKMVIQFQMNQRMD
jgi:hypothetical protein